MDIIRTVLLLAAGFGGGIAASIAGGAALITFPVLLGVGLPPIAANATNAVGLSLSCFTAAAADWRRRPSWNRSFSWLLGINIVGGAIGAFLMLGDPDLETSARHLNELVEAGADMHARLVAHLPERAGQQGVEPLFIFGLADRKSVV